MSQPTIHLVFRPLVHADAELMFGWQNDSTALAASRTTTPATWEGHLAWMAATMRSDDRHVVVAELEGMPVGWVRADRAGRGRVELSWHVDAAMRGRGIGAAMLAQALAHQRGDAAEAHVKPNNAASINLAERAGFRRAGATSDGLVIFERSLMATGEEKRPALPRASLGRNPLARTSFKMKPNAQGGQSDEGSFDPSALGVVHHPCRQRY